MRLHVINNNDHKMNTIDCKLTFIFFSFGDQGLPHTHVYHNNQVNDNFISWEPEGC